MMDESIPTLIRNGHVVDPANGINEVMDILVVNGKIARVSKPDPLNGIAQGINQIDAAGLHILPGIVDARVHVGEPGNEHRETIASASKAAAAGGVTSFIMMADTDPVIDDVSLVDFVTRSARDNAQVNIYPSAAITRGLKGETLTEFGLLKSAGAVVLCEGKSTITNNLLLRRAMTYARDFGMIISQETNDPDLTSNGVMNEGLMATQLGLAGIPVEAEIIPLERDLRLTALTGAAYHAAKVSTAGSAKAIAYYKDNQHNVSAGISINHLSLNENDIGDYRTYFRLTPPLRSEEDRQHMISAIADGTLDMITSSHDPQDADTKRHPFAEAQPGAIGLETLFAAALNLVHNEDITLNRMVEVLCVNPAKRFNLPGGHLGVGTFADLILCDLEKPWVCKEDMILSKSKNTPFENGKFCGKVLQTMAGGKIIYNDCA